MTQKGRLVKGSEEAKRVSRMGCEAHSRQAAKRRKFKETLNIVLGLTVKKGKVVTPEEVTNLADAKNLNVDGETALAISMVSRAIQGDVQAATWVRDTVGEKPTDKIEVDQSLTIEEWAKNHKVKL